MNRTLVLTSFVALIASSDRGLAQASPSLPVIRPKVTELGEFRDTTLNGALTPRESALSPRGTLVAYSNGNDLLIWNVSTRSSRVVLKGWSEGIAWSPAGDAIAFAHHDDQGSQAQVWMLRLNPSNGESVGSPQRVSLTPTTWDSPQFSPDGKSIAFLREDPGERSSLVVAPAAGGTQRVLASGLGIRKLRWAVDGSAVYYVSHRDSAGTKAMLSRVAVNGGAPQLVHDFTGESRIQTLSADNRLVMLSEQAIGAEQTVRIGDLTGRALATVSIPAAVDVAEWSGAYRQVGIRETHPRGLRIINVADGKSLQLIDSTADVQAVAWFEDSHRIAAIVFYDGLGVLVTMNADGTGMRKTPLASRPFRNTIAFGPPVEKFRVSPDGQYAVYLGTGDDGRGGSSLELVNLSTGKQQTLTRARTIFQPFWHRDSKTIRYMRMTEAAQTDPQWLSAHDVSLDGTDRFIRGFPTSQYPRATWLMSENYVSNFWAGTYTLARLDGSPDRILLHGNTTGPGVVSRDGRTIAVTPRPLSSGPPLGKVTLLSASDGSQRILDLPIADIGCGLFSPDGRYLYCRGREAALGPQTLYEVPVDGSKPRVVARGNSRDAGGPIALSPDGKWMLEAVSGVRRVSFVSLDFSDGMTQLLSSSAKR